MVTSPFYDVKPLTKSVITYSTIYRINYFEI